MRIQLKDLLDECHNLFRVIIEFELLVFDQIVKGLFSRAAKVDILDPATLLRFYQPIWKLQLILRQAIQVVVRLYVKHRCSMNEIDTRDMYGAILDFIKFRYRESDRIVPVR